MDNEKNKKVNCSVENCVYHDGETTCNAKQIEVGPQFACCSQETVCATFKPEEN